MAKTKKGKADIEATFAAEEWASSFANTLSVQFPTCTFNQDGEKVTLWCPSKKTLTKIRLESENPCYRRRSISVYTPC